MWLPNPMWLPIDRAGTGACPYERCIGFRFDQIVSFARWKKWVLDSDKWNIHFPRLFQRYKALQLNNKNEKNIEKNILYSIGYSCHTIESFRKALLNNNVTAIADVRSSPFSKFKPEFNKDIIQSILKEIGIAYVFLGNNLGARINAPECYKNGKADYELIAQHPTFLNGLDRLKKGMDNYKIALMCAEKDPITCHRAILIFRNLRDLNIKLYHILCDGTIEDHNESEKRLLKLLKLEQLDLFSYNSAIFDKAYKLQAQKIAYKIDNSVQYSGAST
jgi:hypothetical protein